jgi:sulfide:quinone oxidoreductase
MPSPSKPHVLIAGGGVAAIEGLLALRDLAGDRIELTLLAPDEEFVYRPLAVAAPFDLGKAPRFALGGIVADVDATLVPGSLAAVDPRRHVAWTLAGEELRYDALVLATGAQAQEAVPGALTFTGARESEGFRRLLSELERGAVESAAFAVPAGATWPLPVYELALITAARLSARGADRKLVLVTPEEAPLSLFGRQASEVVADLLRSRQIELRTATHPVEFAHGALTVVPTGSIQVDRVIALPRLRGRAPEGIPSDADSFIPVDPHGLVRGLADVYAAGDAADFPVKQGGIAAQQADVVAAAIAARFGAPVESKPFRPLLRGMLLTGDGARFMRAEVIGGRGERSEVSAEMLWWPEGKIAARYLSHYLARRAIPVEPEHPLGADAIPVDVELTSSSKGS